VEPMHPGTPFAAHVSMTRAHERRAETAQPGMSRARTVEMPQVVRQLVPLGWHPRGLLGPSSRHEAAATATAGTDNPMKAASSSLAPAVEGEAFPTLRSMSRSKSLPVVQRSSSAEGRDRAATRESLPGARGQGPNSASGKLPQAASPGAGRSCMPPGAAFVYAAGPRLHAGTEGSWSRWLTSLPASGSAATEAGATPDDRPRRRSLPSLVAPLSWPDLVSCSCAATMEAVASEGLGIKENRREPEAADAHGKGGGLAPCRGRNGTPAVSARGAVKPWKREARALRPVDAPPQPGSAEAPSELERALRLARAAASKRTATPDAELVRRATMARTSRPNKGAPAQPLSVSSVAEATLQQMLQSLPQHEHPMEYSMEVDSTVGASPPRQDPPPACNVSR